MNQLCEKLKDSIRSEIEKSRAGESDYNIDQLRHILNELEKMATTDNALISYPSKAEQNINSSAPLLSLICSCIVLSVC